MSSCEVPRGVDAGEPHRPLSLYSPTPREMYCTFFNLP